MPCFLLRDWARSLHPREVQLSFSCLWSFLLSLLRAPDFREWARSLFIAGFTNQSILHSVGYVSTSRPGSALHIYLVQGRSLICFQPEVCCFALTKIFPHTSFSRGPCPQEKCGCPFNWDHGNGSSLNYFFCCFQTFGQTFIHDDHFLSLVGSFSVTGRIIFLGFQRPGKTSVGCFSRQVFIQGVTLRVVLKFSVSEVRNMSSLHACPQSMKRKKVSLLLQVAMLCMNTSVFVFMMTLYSTQYGGKAMFLIWICAIFGSFCGNFALFPTATGKAFGPKFVVVNYGLLFTSSVWVSSSFNVLLFQETNNCARHKYFFVHFFVFADFRLWRLRWEPHWLPHWVNPSVGSGCLRWCLSSRW